MRGVTVTELAPPSTMENKKTVPISSDTKPNGDFVSGGKIENVANDEPNKPKDFKSSAENVILQQANVHVHQCPLCDKCKVWWTTVEAAAYLSVSVKTLYNWKSQGKIQGRTFFGSPKGSVRFKQDDLDSVLLGKKR